MPAASRECSPATAAPNDTTAAISSILSNTQNFYQLNAIIFSAEQNGMPILRTALGISTDGVPASTDMHFRIGAVGWQYLTTILLKMVDQRRIALIDPVSRWFPSYPNADRATVRMLAASSAGFGDYVYGQGFFQEITANPFRRWTADELIARSLPPFQNPQYNDPGQDWQYSHTGFVVLGTILERVGEEPYDRLLREMILDPLGLRDTRLQFGTDVQRPVLHTLTDDTFEDSTFWNPSWVSWGALTSNVCDLGVWNRAFATGALLSRESGKEITAPVNVGLGENTASRYFGLGTIVYPPWIVQDASYWGMFTTIAYDPTTGISLEATASLSPGSVVSSSPSKQIIWAVSKLLLPDHPLPGQP
jgi:CubicO group peptidase (beta-lactamase class C family)